MTRGRKPRPLAERFWEKVDTSGGPDACWPWTGAINKQTRYGVLWNTGERATHRIAYTLAVGPIPEGKEIDHVKARGCTMRHCVNPAHLEVVTHAENMRRARKSHCKYGHALTPDNLYHSSRGMRRCRACDLARVNAANARVRERNYAEREAQGRPVTPNKTKTHCPQGHPLTPDNLQPTFLRLGKRYCLTCHRDAQRRAAARARANAHRAQEAA